jgi:hypothetical protein
MASGEPTLAEVIRLAIDSQLGDVFTAAIGVVDKYTATPLTGGPPVVDVKPVIRRPIEDAAGHIQHEALPVIQNVPVVFPASAGYSMTWPLAKGDHVLLVFLTYSHQDWRQTGTLSDPGDLRTHELGNAMAIAGVMPNSKTLPAAANAAVVEVTTPVTHLQVGAGVVQFVSLSNLVNAVLDSIGTAIADAATAPTDGGAAFKTNIVNALIGAGWTSGGRVAPSTAAIKLKSE